MNERSYVGKYTSHGEKMNDLQKLVSGYCSVTTTPIQTLKFLHGIHYNIEPEHMTLDEQGKQDLELLNKYIQGLSSAIISNLAEYKEAAWE